MIKINRWPILIVMVFILFGVFYVIKQRNNYSIFDYFPLNENDKYLYVDYEGAEKVPVTISVKNVVKKNNKEKYFDWVWGGKYNDRIQTLLLNHKGILFIKNKHLVGEAPLKAIRKLNPALLMIPSKLNQNIFRKSWQAIYDYDGNLLGDELIESRTTFIGEENITVPAGKFNTVHILIHHNYKDKSGRSTQMHVYNFWIAPRIGFVKIVHSFVYFPFLEPMAPENKTINNRYIGSFHAVFNLHKAVVGGKIIGN